MRRLRASDMHVLHVFSTFGCGGPQLRLAAIIGSLGTGWSHTIAAMDGNFKAADHVPAETQVEYIAAPPRTALCPYPLVLHRLIRRIRPDLLVTYNWGAIEAVAGALIGSLCPIIHHEHGFGLDEASALKSRRVLARRLLLNRICATIVPSKKIGRE